MSFQSLSFLVPVAAIISWFAYLILNQKYKSQENIAHANDDKLKLVAEESLAVNRQVLERLQDLESRLSGIEKTLSEIPS